MAIKSLRASFLEETSKLTYSFNPSLVAQIAPSTEYSDYIIGTNDDDVIDGLGGSDYIYGAEGDDILSGNSGADIIDGWEGDDILIGGLDDDELLGWYGDDVLRGGTGNDILAGEYGVDVVSGGAGDDYIYADDYEEISADYFNGGAGFDTLDYSYSSAGIGITLSLTTGIGGGAAAGDVVSFATTNGQVYSSIERVLGTEYADNITGSAGNEILDGAGGDDVLSGGLGNDMLVGGAGRDYLLGGNGADILGGGRDSDVLSGGRGSDILAGNTGDDILIGGDGNNKLSGGAGTDTAVWDQGRYVTVEFTDVYGTGVAHVGTQIWDQAVWHDTFSSIENFQADCHTNNVLDWSHATRGNTTIFADLYAGNYEIIGEDAAIISSGTIQGFNWLIGGVGDDYFIGNDGHNFLSGGEGLDVLYGGYGDDRLQGGISDDYIEGGEGYDIATWADLNKDSWVYLDLSVGQPTVAYIYRNIDGKEIFEYDTVSGIEDLEGGSGDDFLKGDDGDNWLFGGAGNDTLDGGNGIGDCDLLDGGAGDDYIIADLSDIIYGWDGFDSVELVGAGRVTIKDGCYIYNADSGDYLGGGYSIEKWIAGNGTIIVETAGPEGQALASASGPSTSSIQAQYEQALADLAHNRTI